VKPVGEPVMIGTGCRRLAAHNDAEANVFYVGASGQIYNRFWSYRRTSAVYHR
jgi:hypothetical protein